MFITPSEISQTFRDVGTMLSVTEALSSAERVEGCDGKKKAIAVCFVAGVVVIVMDNGKIACQGKWPIIGPIALVKKPNLNLRWDDNETGIATVFSLPSPSSVVAAQQHSVNDGWVTFTNAVISHCIRELGAPVTAYFDKSTSHLFDSLDGLSSTFSSSPSPSITPPPPPASTTMSHGFDEGVGDHCYPWQGRGRARGARGRRSRRGGRGGGFPESIVGE